jgi:NitT/TauT family transport system permease protein
MDPRPRRTWGGSRRPGAAAPTPIGVDLVLVLAVAGVLAGVAGFAHEWRQPYRAAVTLDLSPWALPRYTLLSLARGLAAYVLSLGFSLAYGWWAAKDRRAERVLLPLLDVLQSIPVLGFMPGVVLALVALFPHSNVGLELAAILMIFTGQAWNLAFSFHGSLCSIPPELAEVTHLYRFSWVQRLRWLELPFATAGLVWNSMMSMAGGWFFLMISEAFVLGDRDYRLPGLGSYMSVAVARGDVGAMVGAVLAMTLMIVALDRLLWRPLVVWAQRFRVEEGGASEEARSLVLDALRRSRLLAALRERLARPGQRAGRRGVAAPPAWVEARLPGLAAAARSLVLALLAVLLGLGAWRLARLLAPVSLREWGSIVLLGGATLARVLTAVAAGTLWALPAGLAIGLSPRLGSRLQPVVQVLASFPAPMLFPVAVALLRAAGVSLGWGSIALMLLGTQWYILFNVVAGATAMPADLREAARSYRLPLRDRLRVLYVPAVFPYLVTGWVTAAGGAWNASIVSEAVSFRGQILTTFGLGARISDAAARADFSDLAASVVVMAAIVVLFNRMVWRRLQRSASTRFSLAK